MKTNGGGPVKGLPSHYLRIGTMTIGFIAKGEPPRTVTNFALLVFIALFLLSCGPEAPEKVDKADDTKVIVKVNGHPITKGDIERRRKTISGDSPKEKTDDAQWHRLTEQATEAEILDRLLLEAALKKGIEVDSEEVERWATHSKTLMGETEFRNMLMARGASEDEYKEFLRDRIIIENYISLLTRDIDVEEETLQKYYQGHPERFKTPESIRLEVITLKSITDLADIETALRNGDSLEAVAEKFSVKEGGGKAVRTRWMPYDAVPENIRTKCEKESAAAVFSELTEDGNHLVVRILEKKPAGKIAFKEAREQLTTFLFQQQRKKILAEWYDREIQKANIEHFR
jgi:hypothetical protein